MSDVASLQQQVRAAVDRGTPLRLCGSGSKAFYGNPVDGDPLDLTGHAGIISYEPTELVLTARCGTPLREVEAALDEQGQHLSFDPPRFAAGGTLGGAVASGLSGPGRPWGGAPRDVLLGVHLLDGKAQVLRFGGEVMKNVAGYDISRLMAGAQGTLGILLDVSLKVLPRPAKTRTLVLEMNRAKALTRMRELCRQPVPLSGACHYKEQLYLRLSGSHASVNAWQRRIGGEPLAQHTSFWQRLRDQDLDFFKRRETLWRLSLRPSTTRLACETQSLIDWAGGQRWVFSSAMPEEIRSEVAAAGGHAEVFRRGNGDSSSFQSLSPGLLTLHRRLKQRFDPEGLLNRGRLFDE